MTNRRHPRSLDRGPMLGVHLSVQSMDRLEKARVALGAFRILSASALSNPALTRWRDSTSIVSESVRYSIRWDEMKSFCPTQRPRSYEFPGEHVKRYGQNGGSICPQVSVRLANLRVTGPVARNRHAILGARSSGLAQATRPTRAQFRIIKERPAAKAGN